MTSAHSVAAVTASPNSVQQQPAQPTLWDWNELCGSEAPATATRSAELEKALSEPDESDVYDETLHTRYAPVRADRHAADSVAGSVDEATADSAKASTDPRSSTDASSADGRRAAAQNAPADRAENARADESDGHQTAPLLREAAAVIAGALTELAGRETGPFREEPSRPYRLRRLADTDLSVFPVTLGGAAFGWTADQDTARAVLDAYVEAGGNGVATADNYAGGRSETIVGTWLRARRLRDQMVLSTKVGKGELPGLSAASVTRSVEGSLARLGVEHIDLVILAGADLSVPLEETLTAAGALVRAGKVRYLGASGFSAARLMEARILAGQLGVPRFVVVQAPYSVVERRTTEADLAPVARAQALAIMPVAPLAGGFLTGQIEPKSSRHTSSARTDRTLGYRTKRNFRAVEALKTIAGEHGVAPATAALSWLLTKPQVVSPVVNAASVAQVAEVVRAASVHLTRSQVATLDRSADG